jgi:flagella basal body P-ring formation protein FlgA
MSQLQLVPVSLRRVMPGERLSYDDLRMAYVDARIVPPNAITTLGEAEGLEPRWPVPPNAVLTRAQLKAPLVIDRGDVVTAEYRANNIELTTKVVALDGGARGQVIRVRNPSSNKAIQGRVTDVGRVIID